MSGQEVPSRSGTAPLYKLECAHDHEPVFYTKHASPIHYSSPGQRLCATRNLLVGEFLLAKLIAAFHLMRGSGIDSARFGQKRTIAELLRLHETTLARMRD